MDGARAVAPPAHIVLRESTRAAHEAAEASPVMQRLLAGTLDEAGYRKLLEAQWGLLGDWEDQRGQWLTSHVANAGWRYISRAASLTADIRSMWEPLQRRRGLAASVPASAGSPAVAGSHKAALQHETWGELYVVEGSALGARVLVKRLRERFPALPHHFYAIGENSGEPWRRFLAVLDRALAEPAALQAAIDGARRMFARFQQTLQDDAAHV